MASQIINGLGVEPQVIGASFNKVHQSKPSIPIAGTGGVYIIKTTRVGIKPADSPEMIAQQSSSRLSAIRTKTNNWYEGLKKQATIKDNRSKSF